MGQDYEYGIGTETNYTKAVEYYKKSMENGYTYSIYRLGNCYEKGLGVEKNLEKALQWYAKGALQESGEVNCCNRLGDYYYDLADSSFTTRTTALVAASALIPVTNWITIPAALVGSSLRYASKMEKFVKSKEGQCMVKYYQRAADLGSEHAKKRMEELKVYL